MTIAQTYPRSPTLDPPALRGCVCVCRKTTPNPYRKVLTQEKLTPPASTVFHWHFIFCQMPSQAALRMIKSPQPKLHGCYAV
jgi:hypothetical protein